MTESPNPTEIASTVKVLTQGSSTMFLPLLGMDGLTIERHFREQDTHSWKIIREQLRIQATLNSVFAEIDRTAGVQFLTIELVELLAKLDPTMGIEDMYEQYLAN